MKTPERHENSTSSKTQEDDKSLRCWVKRPKTSHGTSNQVSPPVNPGRNSCRLQPHDILPKLKIGSPCCLTPQNSIEL